MQYWMEHEHCNEKIIKSMFAKFCFFEKAAWSNVIFVLQSETFWSLTQRTDWNLILAGYFTLFFFGGGTMRGPVICEHC